MIYSMTGFGRSEVNDDLFSYNVEIRSVNNRYLDINTHLPRSLVPYEYELRSEIKKRINRGKVNLSIQEPRSAIMETEFGIDTDAVKNLIKSLQVAGKEAKLKDDLSISHLIPLLNLLQPADKEELSERRIDLAKKGLQLALDEFNKMCRDEGYNLEKDLRLRIKIISDVTDNIESKAEENFNTLLDRLKQRIEKHISTDKMDIMRLEQEVALMVDKTDITEEIVRLRSHLNLFEKSLDNGNNVGKRLNFILQEMNREINTIGSKAACAEVTGWVVQIKEELEKIREQVQNLV